METRRFSVDTLVGYRPTSTSPPPSSTSPPTAPTSVILFTSRSCTQAFERQAVSSFRSVRSAAPFLGRRGSRCSQFCAHPVQGQDAARYQVGCAIIIVYFILSLVIVERLNKLTGMIIMFITVNIINFPSLIKQMFNNKIVFRT